MMAIKQVTPSHEDLQQGLDCCRFKQEKLTNPFKSSGAGSRVSDDKYRLSIHLLHVPRSKIERLNATQRILKLLKTFTSGFDCGGDRIGFTLSQPQVYLVRGKAGRACRPCSKSEAS